MEGSQIQLPNVAPPRNQNFADLIVENCEDCLAILNLEGQVVWANTIAQREWGIDETSSSDCLTWTRGWPNDSRDQIDEAICSARGDRNRSISRDAAVAERFRPLVECHG